MQNDYANSANVEKGIIFGRNQDGSCFTFRPIMSQNILQLTKNDSSGLMNLYSNGNVSFSGDISTGSGVSLNSHTHDNRYYTGPQIVEMLNSKASISMSGNKGSTRRSSYPNLKISTSNSGGDGLVSGMDGCIILHAAVDFGQPNAQMCFNVGFKTSGADFSFVTIKQVGDVKINATNTVELPFGTPSLEEAVL